MKTALVAGASRGLGAAVAAHLAAAGWRVLGASRTPSVAGTWIEADLATQAGLSRVGEAVEAAVGDGPLHALLHMGGTWEREAYSPRYRFLDSDEDETRRVIAVNLVAPIELARRLAPLLARAEAPLVGLMGANMALEGRARPEVANTASKAGLRGAAASLRATLRPLGIATTLFTPANMATDEVMEDIARGDFAPQTPIPLSDLTAALDFALGLSPATEIEEIVLGQRDPG
ncbi:MAG: SDR family NAD(P)-dependent oxidoreductase [Pseudomonadota bacterium]